MNAREEFKLCFGVARSRVWGEDGIPFYSGMPKRLVPALETALYSYDKLERKQPGSVLRIMKEKCDPFNPRNMRHFNCRCVARPIELVKP